MLLAEETVCVWWEGISGNSELSAQVHCEPKIALKSILIFENTPDYSLLLLLLPKAPSLQICVHFIFTVVYFIYQLNFAVLNLLTKTGIEIQNIVTAEA